MSEELLTEDGKFACTRCKGKGYSILNDEASKFKDEKWRCAACRGTGHEIESVRLDMDVAEGGRKRAKKELDELREWIKKTSTCKTCEGNQMKTWGGIGCEECGLEGTCPWPG